MTDALSPEVMKLAREAWTNANLVRIGAGKPGLERAALVIAEAILADRASCQARVEELERQLATAKRDGDIQDELLDSQYRAGAQAGWNAQFAADPDAAIAGLTHVPKGALSAIRAKRDAARSALEGK